MKWVLIALLLIFFYLQFQLWVGKGSFAEVSALKREIAAQQKQLDEYQTRNDALHAEVKSLKKDLEAVEERARSDLGMIGKDEIFFQIPESRQQEQQQ